MKKIISLTVISLFVFSCTSTEAEIEKWKEEVVNTEKEFALMLSEKGLQKAFSAFADQDAVLMRDNKLIKGKTNIDKFHINQNTKNLSWKPSFVDVAASGDLAYTYGNYVYTFTDSLGVKQESTGVFHTVWKKQADGKWKFVWD